MPNETRDNKIVKSSEIFKRLWWKSLLNSACYQRKRGKLNAKSKLKRENKQASEHKMTVRRNEMQKFWCFQQWSFGKENVGKQESTTSIN